MSKDRASSLKLNYISQLTFGLSVAFFFLAGCASTPHSKSLNSDERFGLLMDMGNASLSENDPTGALDHFFQAEKENPKSPQLHHSLALAYYQKRNHAKALEEAKIAITLEPNYSEANNTYGRLLIESNRLYEASPYLEKAANDPLYRDAYKSLTNLGILHYRTQQFSRASEDFTRAIEAAPQASCVAYYYSGHLALRVSNFKQAIADYERATRKFCANFPDAHLALGIAYQGEHQYDLARKKFLEIEKNYPNTVASEQAIHHLKNIP